MSHALVQLIRIDWCRRLENLADIRRQAHCLLGLPHVFIQLAVCFRLNSQQRILRVNGIRAISSCNGRLSKFIIKQIAIVRIL